MFNLVTILPTYPTLSVPFSRRQKKERDEKGKWERDRRDRINFEGKGGGRTYVLLYYLGLCR